MTCGLACARMLLGYFGFEVTEKEILSETYMHKFGSWYSDLARPFIKRGLKTKIYTINVNIYSPSWAGENKDKLRQRLIARKSELKGLLQKETEKMIEYLDAGGNLEVKIPDTGILIELLKRQPIMIPVLRSLIYDDTIDESGHYLVVYGYDGENYSVLDPSIEQRNGKEFKVKKEILEYAWLANNRDSDGYLMEVGDKK